MSLIINPYRFVSAATDPFFANVKSLLHFDGANGSTTITDQIAGHAWSVLSNAALSTAQAKFGPSSLVLDGANDAAQATSADFIVGNGDFTAEGWIYPNILPVNWIIFDQRPDGTQGVYPTVYASDSQLKFFTDSADRITGGTIAPGAWQHWAYCRASGTGRLFLAGTQVGANFADANNYIGNRIRLGASGFDTGLGMVGFQDDYRLTVGVARYTSNFTPPTAAFPNS